MKRKLHKVKSFLLMLTMLYFGVATGAQETGPKVAEGVIRVKLKPELSAQVNEIQTHDGSAVITGVLPIDELCRTFNATKVKRVFRYDPKFEHKLRKHGLHLWYEVTYTNRAEVHSVAKDYGQLAEIEIAEPIYIPQLTSSKPVVLTDDQVAELLTNRGEDHPFDDPYLPRQWHYNNTGQTGGTVGADVNMYEAWKVETGSSDIIVAIHDQGVQWDHEDLHANMWVNEAELNGEDMVDDDGNGWKDDIYGFNFAHNKGAIDADYHGTHVAGTVGAMNNNGIGVSGVAGGTDTKPGVKMMTLQLFGGVSDGNTPESYVYAANNGAVISQNSWGYQTPEFVNQAVLDGIDYFIEEAGDYEGSPMKGGIVIFASGNNSSDLEHWPNAYDKVISVSSLDAKWGKASYSNYHSTVDISAPGGESGDDNLIPEGSTGYSNGVLSTLNNNAYGYLDGTSMACPHVSGIAALVLSKYGGEGFTPEKLKTHLLTGVINIDTVPENEAYINMLGHGATDAVLALIEDTKEGPFVTSDLSVTGVSQEFAKLEWTVPADEADGIAASFEVVYSESPITEGSLEFSKVITFENDQVLGDVVKCEVGDLSALTTYYFRIYSLDRWGNRSELSNEVSATTNSGPDARIDKSGFTEYTEYIGWSEETGDMFKTGYYLPVVIDAQESLIGSNSFNLHNDGEGLLRWEVLQRHIESNTASTNTPAYLNDQADVNYDNVNLRAFGAPFYGDMKLFAQEEANGFKSYIAPFGASYYYIGETDIEIPNSAATRFLVEEEGGFNLTDAEFFLNYESTEESPVIFEVYKGYDINNATLTYTQELTETNINWNSFNLEEQIYFEQGEYFWMVIHIPAGNLYPLGASVEYDKDASKNCYMSLNKGKSWALFEDLYYDNNIVWAVNAISRYKTPGEYLIITPESGEVESGQFTEVVVGADISEMINGTYKANVVIETNETGESQLRAETWLEVVDHQPVIKGESIVEFGSVLLGNQKVIEVVLRNEGYGKFHRPEVTFSKTDGVFTMVDYPSTINPLSEYSFRLVYNPIELGNASCKVTFSNSYGQSHEFSVTGVCAEPPVMEVLPEVITYNDITIGDELSGEFTIQNSGNFPLSFYLPAFSSGELLGDISNEFCKYGYTFADNGGGNYTLPEYEWDDISSSGTELNDYDREHHYFHYPVEFGFDFPFFGKLESKVYITNFGVLSFDTNSSFSKNPIYFKDEHSHDRFISALGKWHDLSLGGKIFYQDKGDRFIVQYDKVIYPYFDPMNNKVIEAEFTYQIVLMANGNIHFYYKNWGGIPEEDVTMWSFFGIEDKTTDDGLLVSEQYMTSLSLGNEMAVKITNPGLGLLKEVSVAEGTIEAGESISIDFTASTDILNVGQHVENVPIITNDPFNNPGIVSLDINVTRGGESKLIISNTEFDYGQVFQGDTKECMLWVVNEGRANDVISGIALENDLFTVVGELPLELAPKRKTLYTIGVNTQNLGVLNDVLTITTDNGEEFTIILTAEITEAPQISTDISEITETLNDNEQVSRVINITNNGGNNLEFAPIGNDWLTVSEASIMANQIPEFTYYWERSENEGGPTYTWEEIAVADNHVGVLDVWEEVGEGWTDAKELPFNFNYYGVDYNQLFIGANGVMTFTETDVCEGFGANGLFPTSLEPNNVIAPMWGFIYPTWYEEDAGVYFHANEDRAIIQWHKFIDGFYMAYPISFQVVLYPDGNIKMQYNMSDAPSEALTNFSGIGLENADGTDGVTVGWAQYSIVKDRTALLFTPIKKTIVEPGESKSIEVTLSSENIYTGEYNYDFMLFNNTPDNGEYTIPVSLTVTGEAKPEYPAIIDYGTVQAYGQEFIKEFEIKNNGNKPLGIRKFIMNDVTSTRIEAWVPMELGYDGDTYMAWKDVNELNQSIYYVYHYINPNESLKLRAIIAPTTADAISDNLEIMNDTGNEMWIAITATPELPPVLTVSNELIEVYAPTIDHTEALSFQLSNVDGNSTLDYEMDIMFIRDLPAEVQSTKSSASPLSNAPVIPLKNREVETTKSRLKNTSGTKVDYNRVLEYENAEHPENALGYGGGLVFNAATRFEAPKDGFNLSHVQTWYIPGEWLDSKIVVSILTGAEMIYDCQVVYSQEYNHVIDANDAVGSYITLALDEPQLFYPEEKFYVAFQFPTGALYPQGAARVDEQVAGRFMFGDGENWFDIIDAGFPESGWMIKALEDEFKVAVWAEIETELTGSITSGEQVQVDMNFDARNADHGINKAEITIRSNDPINPKVVLPVTLTRNMGPLFNLGSEAYVSVNESEVLDFDVIASDNEGDDFTLRMAEDYNNVTTTFADGVLKFSLSTDYESAGIHTYEVLGEDVYGNTSSLILTVDVVNVNQMPTVATPLETVMITLPADSIAIVDFNEMFIDPDGDALEFAVIADLFEGLEAFVSYGKIVFKASAIGSIPVTVKAYDPDGAMVESSFDLVARMRTGIDDQETSDAYSVYPNPVEDVLTISSTENIKDENSEIRLVDITGTTVYLEKFDGAINNNYQVNMSQFDPGVYFVEIHSGDKLSVIKVIKI